MPSGGVARGVAAKPLPTAVESIAGLRSPWGSPGPGSPEKTPQSSTHPQRSPALQAAAGEWASPPSAQARKRASVHAMAIDAALQTAAKVAKSPLLVAKASAPPAAVREMSPDSEESSASSFTTSSSEAVDAEARRMKWIKDSKSPSIMRKSLALEVLATFSDASSVQSSRRPSLQSSHRSQPEVVANIVRIEEGHLCVVSFGFAPVLSLGDGEHADQLASVMADHGILELQDWQVKVNGVDHSEDDFVAAVDQAIAVKTPLQLSFQKKRQSRKSTVQSFQNDSSSDEGNTPPRRSLMPSATVANLQVTYEDKMSVFDETVHLDLVPLFEALFQREDSPPCKEALVEGWELEMFQSGQIVIDAGHLLRDLLIVQEGVVGTECCKFWAGCCIGLGSVLRVTDCAPGEGMTYTALSECKVLRLPRAHLEQMGAWYPRLGEAVEEIRKSLGARGPAGRLSPLTGFHPWAQVLCMADVRLARDRNYILTDGLKLVTAALGVPTVQDLVAKIQAKAAEYQALPFTVAVDHGRVMVTYKSCGVVRTRARLQCSTSDDFLVAEQVQTGTETQAEIQVFHMPKNQIAVNQVYTLDTGVVLRTPPTMDGSVKAVLRAILDATPDRGAVAMTVGYDSLPFTLTLSQCEDALELHPRPDAPASSAVACLSGKDIKRVDFACRTPFFDSHLFQLISPECREALLDTVEREVVLPGLSLLNTYGVDNNGRRTDYRAAHGFAIFLVRGSATLQVDGAVVEEFSAGRTFGLGSLVGIFWGPRVDVVASTVCDVVILHQDPFVREMKAHKDTGDALLLKQWYRNLSTAGFSKPKPGHRSRAEAAADEKELDIVKSVARTDHEFRRELVRAKEVRVLFPGEFLCKQGDAAATMLIMACGGAQLHVGGLVKDLAAGLALGEEAWLGRASTRTATIRVQSVAVVSVFHRGVLEALSQRHPEEGKKVGPGDSFRTDATALIPCLRNCSHLFQQAISKHLECPKATGTWEVPDAAVVPLKGSAPLHSFQPGEPVQVRTADGTRKQGKVHTTKTVDHVNLQVQLEDGGAVDSFAIDHVFRRVGTRVEKATVQPLFEAECFNELCALGFVKSESTLHFKQPTQVVLLKSSALSTVLAVEATTMSPPYESDRQNLQDYYNILLAQPEYSHLFDFASLSVSFHKMSESCCAILQKGMVRQVFVTGSVIVREGQASDYLYVVCKGTASVTMGFLAVGIVAPGSFFGQTAASSGDSKAGETVQAQTAMLVVAIPQSSFLAAREAYPEDFVEFDTYLSDRFADLTNVKCDQLFESAVFAACTDEFKDYVSRHLQKVTLAPGDVLMHQNAEGHEMYFVARGSIEVVINNVRVNTIVAGEVVGEMAALGVDSRRSATCVALTICVLFQLSRDVLEQTLRLYPDQKSAFAWRCRSKNEDKLLERVNRADAFADVLGKGSLGFRARSRISNKLESKLLLPGDVIVRAGQKGSELFLIDFGVAMATLAGKTWTINHHGQGEVWGELCFLQDEPRYRLTIVAQTICHVRCGTREALWNDPVTAPLFDHDRVKQRVSAVRGAYAEIQSQQARIKVKARSKKAFQKSVASLHGSNLRALVRPEEAQTESPRRAAVCPPGFDAAKPAMNQVGLARGLPDIPDLGHAMFASIFSDSGFSVDRRYPSCFLPASASGSRRGPRPDFSASSILSQHLRPSSIQSARCHPQNRPVESRSTVTMLRYPVRPTSLACEWDEEEIAPVVPAEMPTEMSLFTNLRVAPHWVLCGANRAGSSSRPTTASEAAFRGR